MGNSTQQSVPACFRRLCSQGPLNRVQPTFQDCNSGLIRSIRHCMCSPKCKIQKFPPVSVASEVFSSMRASLSDGNMRVRRAGVEICRDVGIGFWFCCCVRFIVQGFAQVQTKKQWGKRVQCSASGDRIACRKALAALKVSSTLTFKALSEWARVQPLKSLDKSFNPSNLNLSEARTKNSGMLEPRSSKANQKSETLAGIQSNHRPHVLYPNPELKQVETPKS